MSVFGVGLVLVLILFYFCFFRVQLPAGLSALYITFLLCHNSLSISRFQMYPVCEFQLLFFWSSYGIAGCLWRTRLTVNFIIYTTYLLKFHYFISVVYSCNR